MAKESALKRSVMAYLASRFPAAAVRKRHGTVFSTAGDPDIYFLLGGRHFEVELKVPGESPTPLQKHRLAQWSAAGAVTACIHSLAELERLLADNGYRALVPPLSRVSPAALAAIAAQAAQAALAAQGKQTAARPPLGHDQSLAAGQSVQAGRSLTAAAKGQHRP